MQTIRKHLVYFLIITGVIILYNFSGIGCPIKALLGVPCPTCGMTRSFLALLRFDIETSLAYNPMTLLMVIAFWLGIHKSLFKGKKLIDIIIIVFSMVTFLYYVINTIT